MKPSINDLCFAHECPYPVVGSAMFASGIPRPLCQRHLDQRRQWVFKNLVEETGFLEMYV